MLLVVSVASALAVAHPVHADDCLSSDAQGCMFGLPTFQYQTLVSQMIANPSPNVRPLDVDASELGVGTTYRVIGGAAPVYDAPHGKTVGLGQKGYGPLRVGTIQDNWAQIGYKRYVRTQDITTASASTFAGVLFDAPLAYPMAWVLAPTRPSTIPGQKASSDAPILERYQRVNIFEMVLVGDWNW